MTMTVGRVLVATWHSSPPRVPVVVVVGGGSWQRRAAAPAGLPPPHPDLRPLVGARTLAGDDDVAGRS